MMTWTVSSLKGRDLNAVAVVSADDVYLAIVLLQKELSEQLIPMVTTTRKVRILFNGDY